MRYLSTAETAAAAGGEKQEESEKMRVGILHQINRFNKFIEMNTNNQNENICAPLVYLTRTMASLFFLWHLIPLFIATVVLFKQFPAKHLDSEYRFTSYI